MKKRNNGKKHEIIQKSRAKETSVSTYGNFYNQQQTRKALIATAEGANDFMNPVTWKIVFNNISLVQGVIKMLTSHLLDFPELNQLNKHNQKQFYDAIINFFIYNNYYILKLKSEEEIEEETLSTALKTGEKIEYIKYISKNNISQQNGKIFIEFNFDRLTYLTDPIEREKKEYKDKYLKKIQVDISRLLIVDLPGTSYVGRIAESFTRYAKAIKSVGDASLKHSFPMLGIKGLSEVLIKHPHYLNNRLEMLTDYDMYGAFAYDKENEELSFGSPNFSGMKENTDILKEDMAAVSGIPLPILFPNDVSGFQNTGNITLQTYERLLNVFFVTTIEPLLKDLGIEIKEKREWLKPAEANINFQNKTLLTEE